MRIDAHQHFWRPARGDYEWLTPNLERLWDDFLPADLAPVIARNDIGRTILVQAAPTEAETRFLLGLAGETPFVAGVVGWSDFEAPEARVNISRLAADPLLVGLRPMVQDLPDDGWLAGEDLDDAFAALAEHGLVFDALLKPRHIPAMLARLARSPGIPVVIDHAAKPDIAGGDLAEWRAGIVLLSQHENVVCKLSGLVTEAGQDWSVETLRPVVDDLLAAFGPERLLWGSDWPVLRLTANYDRWVAATDALLAGLSAPERDAILGGNAERIYLSRRGRRPRREPAADE
jgi:L-fuconolactonase